LIAMPILLGVSVAALFIGYAATHKY